MFSSQESCAPLGLELPQPPWAPSLIFLASVFKIFNNNLISSLLLMVGQEATYVKYFNISCCFHDCFNIHLNLSHDYVNVYLNTVVCQRQQSHSNRHYT